MLEEAEITVNGTRLSLGQSMAVRVACSAFYEDMSRNTDALGDDEHGRKMAAAYAERLREVLRLIVNGKEIEVA